MDKQVEEVVRACHPCQLVGPRVKPGCLRDPEGPWKEISIDLLDVSSGEHLLVVVDYYSHWIEVILLKKTDAHHMVKSMEAIFRTHDQPECVRSDNGPPLSIGKPATN